MLGERVPAPQALEWGLINRVVRRRRVRGRGRRAGRAARHRPDALLRRLQAPAQRLAVLAAWTSSSSSRPTIQQEMAASGDFLEGVAGLPASKRPARFRDVDEGGQASPTTARPARPTDRLPRPWVAAAAKRRLRRAVRCAAVAGLAARCSARPIASAGLFFPERAARRTPTTSRRSTSSSSASALVVFIGVEGVLIWLAVQVPGPPRPRRGADPRQHAAGDRLDGRRRA